MSFPLNFQFAGISQELEKQIGNAVPPRFLMHWPGLLKNTESHQNYFQIN